MAGKASSAKAAVGDKAVSAYIKSLPQPRRRLTPTRRHRIVNETVAAAAIRTTMGSSGACYVPTAVGNEIESTPSIRRSEGSSTFITSTIALANSVAGSRSPIGTSGFFLMPTAISTRNGIQVISRAVAVLQALEGHPDGLTLGQLAEVVGLPRSTVQRIVDALDVEGFVIASSRSTGVRLGPRLLGIAHRTRFPMAELARDTMRAVSAEFGETVDLAILDRSTCIIVDQIVGRHRLAAVLEVGISLPLHSSANGKAILAALSERDLSRLRRRKLVACTPHTIKSWEELDQEVAAIRASGIAYDREEHSPGICAVGVALESPSGELGAISVSVPDQRFRQIEGKLAEALLKRSARLQAQLTGSKPSDRAAATALRILRTTTST